MVRVKLELLDTPATSVDSLRKVVDHKLFLYSLQPINALWNGDLDEGGWYSLKSGLFMDNVTSTSRLLYLGRLYALIDTFSIKALEVWAQYIWQWRWTKNFSSELQRTMIDYIASYVATVYEHKTGLPGWWIWNFCSLKNCKTTTWLEEGE